MKYYIILGTCQGGYSSATVKAKNKFDAIKEARTLCPSKNYIPVSVKRISKKHYNFIFLINKEQE